MLAHKRAHKWFGRLLCPDTGQPCPSWAYPPLLIGRRGGWNGRSPPRCDFLPARAPPWGTPPFSFGSPTRPYILIRTNKQLPPHAVWSFRPMAKSRRAQTGLGSTSESYSARDKGAACRWASNDRRKPGAQPGNKNALKHGQRTAKARRRQKLAHASLKALQHLLNSQGMVPRSEGRIRPRPIRTDQMALLIEAEPELAAMVRAVGAYLPDLSTGRHMAAACEDICDAKDCALVNIVG